MLRSAGGKRSRLLLLLAVAGTARAAEPFSVVALGQADVPSSATVHTMPGQVALRPPRPEPSSLPSPGLVVLVDGKARLLIDPASGTLSAARAAGLDLAEVSAVLLGSMAPASTAELPTLLARRDGPAGEVRLVGPAGPGPWPSPGRWAEALFGPSGLYAATRSAPRSLRLVASEVKPGTERRMSLGSGVELRTRVRTTPDGPRAAFRLERGGTAVVLAGEPSPEALPALTPLARGAALVVASVPDRAAVEALAKLASTAEVRALWVIATGEEVRRTADEERRTLGAAAPLTWSSTARLPVAAPPLPGAPTGPAAPGAVGCQSDADCGPGKVCLGCSEDRPKECVAGCRSKADCPAGQACLPVQCIRCPCPPQCSG